MNVLFRFNFMGYCVVSMLDIKQVRGLISSSYSIVKRKKSRDEFVTEGR